MWNELCEVWRYRELLLNLVIRDMKVRYKSSVLGFFWSLANPLVQVATITIVVKYALGVKVPNYSAYLLCAFLPWTFFQMSILDASQSVLFHSGLVKKTYFPREILPMSIVFSNLIHFILALVVFFLYTRWLGTPILTTWLFMPVVILIQLMLNMGVAFFVSCLNVFYADVKYMVTALMNLLFYLTPIIYPMEKVVQSSRISPAYRPLVYKAFMINPLSFVMTAYRKILLPAQDLSPNHDIPLNYWYLLVAGIVSFLVLVSGYAFFNSRKWKFAERV